jgi:dolichol-phosphate mannosyltransferase
LKAWVIIPTYNEAENLPGLVSALFLLPLDLSVVVVDDNSPDETGQIAELLAEEHTGRLGVLHRPAKLGLRGAYLQGFKLALDSGAEAVIQMDADFSHDPAKLVEMVQMLRSCDVAFGSRYVPGGSVDERWSVWRKRLSAFGNFYARTVLGIPWRDMTTGFRIWRRETLLGIPLERINASGYVFLVEMAYMAWCLGYRIGEVPIHFAERRSGESKMSLQIQLEAAMQVWRVRWAFRDLRAKGIAGRKQLTPNVTK